MIKPINPDRIPTKDYDKAGELTLNHPTERVALTDIVYGKYQRALIKTHMLTMVLSFFPQLFIPPVLAERAGDLWCVDGQHRIEAIRRLGATHVHAMIVPVATRKDEIWLFTKLNTATKTLNVQTLYTAALAMNRNVAKTIDRVLKDNGLTAVKGEKHSRQTINSIKELYAAFGEKVDIDAHLTSAEQLKRGEKTLDWALRAVHHLIDPRGLTATSVYSSKTLRALITIKNNAQNNDDLDLDLIAEILGSVKDAETLS